MKTVTISVLAVAIVMWIINNSTLCICAAAIPSVAQTSAAYQGDGTRSVDCIDAQDVCKDCGHSETCCVTHTPSYMLSTNLTRLTLSHYLIVRAPLWDGPVSSSVPKISLASNNGERAPPYLVRPTPVSLNQIQLN